MSRIPALEVKNLTVAYRSTLVLRDINISVAQGMFVGVIGANGAGKTTFLNAIVQLVPAIAGVILCHGKPYDHIAADVAYVAQRATIDWRFPINALELVLMGCYGRLGLFRSPSSSDYEQARTLLAHVGLSEYTHRHIGELSGGQQQRILFARALMQNAHIYLFDEPMAGVDTRAKKDLFLLLDDLRQAGKTILMVHHQWHEVREWCDRVLFLDHARSIFGLPEAILGDKHLYV